MVSIIIHAVLLLVAFFFVAVSVIKKDDVDFEVKNVERPKMNLKKLQVPGEYEETAEKAQTPQADYGQAEAQ